MPVCVLIPIRVLAIPLPVMGICAFWYQHIYHITLDPSASTAPRQCVPLCPAGSSEEQSGSIARPNCIKPHPSTSSAPTSTAWAPNCTFGLPLCTQQRFCNQLHTVGLSASAPQCNAGLCVSHTPREPCRRVEKSTGDMAPDKVRVPLPYDMLRGYGNL
jgi:hypothetical protein